MDILDGRWAMAVPMATATVRCLKSILSLIVYCIGVVVDQTIKCDGVRVTKVMLMQCEWKTTQYGREYVLFPTYEIDTLLT